MIRSFKCKETEKIFNRERSVRFDEMMQRVAYRKLRMLHRAYALQDLRSPPTNHLEKLKGNREGQYSIRINDRYRLCFVWQDGDALQVEIVDYH